MLEELEDLVTVFRIIHISSNIVRAYVVSTVHIISEYVEGSFQVT